MNQIDSLSTQRFTALMVRLQLVITSASENVQIKSLFVLCFVEVVLISQCSSAWGCAARWLTLGQINSHSSFLSERIRDQIQCFWLLWDPSVWQSECSTGWMCTSTSFPLDSKYLLELNPPSLWEETSWSCKWMESVSLYSLHWHIQFEITFVGANWTSTCSEWHYSCGL